MSFNMSDIFDLGELISEKPHATWVLEGSQVEKYVPVTTAMALSDKPERIHTDVSALSESGKSGSSDSMMKVLLQPPQSITVVEPSQKRSPSQDSMMRVLLQPPPSITVVEPSQERSPSQDGTGLSGPNQPSSSSEPTVLEASAPAVVEAADEFEKLVKDDPVLSWAADFVERAGLTEELRNDKKMLGRTRRRRRRPWCTKCGVKRHPSQWSYDRKMQIHLYSFLLDWEDLMLSKSTALCVDSSKTFTVHIVPMDYNNPIKIKAERVLRYMDVEVGRGDQTVHNTLHYIQPSNRKMLMVVSHGWVVGIVVAEEIKFAHRILYQNTRYIDLHKNPVPVRVGINRLWVHISKRRRHLATVLCQLIGRFFCKEETLRIEDYAFNNNSKDMVIFAKKFLKTRRPPLYSNLK